MSTVLVFAFSPNTRLEDGFWGVHGAFSSFLKGGILLSAQCLGIYYPVPTVRQLGCFPSWLCQRSIFFCIQAGLRGGQISLLFEAPAVQGERGRMIGDICPNYVLGSSP